MRHLKRLPVLAAVIVAMLAVAAPAGAAPAPGYEEFTGCPDKTVNPANQLCVSSTVSGGHLLMGSKNSPIVDPITLTGAVPSLLASAPFTVGTFDGGRQPVPGGLVGITGLDWLIYLFPNNVLGLYAETELASTNLSNPTAPQFTLPIKVKLDNVLLSDTCYIGSDTDPIVLNLTTGTTAPPPPNQPITGAFGTQVFPPNTSPAGVIRVQNRVLVDNAFAAPEANGCDLLLPGFGLIDTIVNLQAGLPSPAGTNETVQEVDGAISPLTVVYPPDGID